MKYKQLTSEQRYIIAQLVQRGTSQVEIASIIGVSPSTICRELKRNSKVTRSGELKYSSSYAVMCSSVRKERIKVNGKKSDSMMAFVRAKLLEDWSPEQISGYLSKRGERISTTCIYNYIHADKRSGGDLWRHTRHRLKHRDRDLYKDSGATHIPNRVDISSRPKEADGSRFGDWEMDTIVGPDNKGALLTLAERSTIFSIDVPLPRGKNAEAVAETVIRELLPYKKAVLTITTDNGSEFACHEMIAKALGATVYFARPYHSWEKGCIENHNGLLRQYIPKGTDVSGISYEEVKGYQHKLNSRPRKKLGFESPKDVFFRQLEALRD